jgi:hypothetical protein
MPRPADVSCGLGLKYRKVTGVRVQEYKLSCVVSKKFPEIFKGEVRKDATTLQKQVFKAPVRDSVRLTRTDNHFCA